MQPQEFPATFSGNQATLHEETLRIFQPVVSETCHDVEGTFRMMRSVLLPEPAVRVLNARPPIMYKVRHQHHRQYGQH